MQKRRATRTSTKDKNEVLDEFKFSNQQTLNKISSKQKSKKINPSPSESKICPPNQLSIQLMKNQQSQNQSQTITKGAKEIKKKKVSKKQQNQGIRILQQKQTQRIFQHLCNPDGLITVQSIGRIMVRAKKDFQIEDLQNMIAYYGTIKKKLQTKKESQKNEKNQNQKLIAKQKQKHKGTKMQLLSELQYNMDSQQNFQDDLDQSDHQQDYDFYQEDQKTQLNFQEFKIIKEYFDK